MAYVCNRTVFVFGVALEHDGGAARPIAFVGQLFVCRSLDFAGATLNGTLNIVCRHRSVSRLLDRQSQSWVCARIASARARRHDNLTAELREDLAALRVLFALADSNVLPLGVACHRFYFDRC